MLPQLARMLPSTQATNRFLNDYAALQMVNTCGQIDFQVLKLVETKRPTASVRPDILPVEPVQSLQPHRLRPERRHRTPRHPPGPGAALGEGHSLVEDEGDSLSGAESDDPMEELEDLADEPGDADLDALLEESMDLDLGATLQEPPAAGEGPLDVRGATDADPAAEGGVPEAPLARGAGDEPAVLPPPAAAAARPRKNATVTVEMPGGSVSFYESKQAFQAVCEHRGHGRCVATRTRNSRGLTSDGFPMGGRPVGFLAAWLQRGEHCLTKAAHWMRRP